MMMLQQQVKALKGLKTDVTALLAQANGREATEVDRLVKVFEGMKAKDAAPRLAALDDGVRLKIAAKMKERSLSSIVGLMPPAEAKKLTEALARRFTDAQAAAAKAQAEAAAPPKAAPAAAPAKTAARAPAKPAPKKKNG